MNGNVFFIISSIEVSGGKNRYLFWDRAITGQISLNNPFDSPERHPLNIWTKGFTFALPDKNNHKPGAA
jgi:hypothetical protein